MTEKKTENNGLAQTYILTVLFALMFGFIMPILGAVIMVCIMAYVISELEYKIIALDKKLGKLNE